METTNYLEMTKEQLIELLSRRQSSSELSIINKVKGHKGEEFSIEINGVTVKAVQTGFMLDKRSAAFLVDFEIVGFGIKFKRDVATIATLHEDFKEAADVKASIRKRMQANSETFDTAVAALKLK